MNVLEYAQILQTELDKQAIQVATSGWMEGNSGQVQYNGGKEIKIPKMGVTGLGDYDRDGGKYPNAGSINLSYQTVELTQDRAATFNFDRHDVDETNYMLNATAVMNEFQRTQVIPEIDAYRYSSIATRIIDAGKAITYTPAVTTIIKQFLTDIRNMQDKTGIDSLNVVATIPYSIYAMFEQSTELQKMLTPQQFEQGGLNFEVKSIDGVPLIPVTSSRMKTKYILNDGSTDFGFKPDATAKNINWIICPRTAPIAVSKTDNLKIWAPDQNQNGDSWVTQYRKYHDLWVKDNQLDTFVVSIGA